MNKKFTKIEDLGWDDFFEDGRQKLGLVDFPVARVIAEHKGGYKIKNEKGEFVAKITGKQMFEAGSREDYPAVGDWVAITELDSEQAKIESILPRKSIIKRKFGDKDSSGKKSDVQIIATNIDTAFVVQAIGRDYNLNRLERYLSILKNENIKPVIVLNKIDLISEKELKQKLAEIKQRLNDCEVVVTSVKDNKNIEDLRSYIEKGRTYCFLGSSGVGKSSLINKLLGEKMIKTGDVSEYSSRGRHVTTNRETYFLKEGGIIIDNPGVREIGMTSVGEGVDSVFDKISLLAKECKYADCTHIREPGCAVLLALKEGKMDQEKYSNYLNLKKEAEYSEMDEFEKRKKNRDFGKFIKKTKKDLKKYKHKDY